MIAISRLRTSVVNSSWRMAWMAFLVNVAAVIAVPAFADSARIDIAAQPMPAALQAFAAQTHLQLLYRYDDVASARANAVSGELDMHEALRRLLLDSGLEATYSSSEGVTIRPVSRKSNAPLAPLPNGKPIANANSSENSTPAPALEEIVVSAQKRAENLMDVPASVTVLSAASLENQGAIDFFDYKTLVPSLSDFTGGAEGHGAIILRGLNTGYYQTSNTVGYYIDDIPFSATSPLSYGTYLTLDPDLTDIDHLEVLKGPQATLYGGSTLGGLIKVVSKKPDPGSNSGEMHLDASTIDHGGTGYGVSGVANVVLVSNELALRVSAFDRETPGYMRNLTLDTTDRNVSRKKGGKIALRWLPTEDLDIRVSAMTQSLFVGGWNYEFVDLQTLAPLSGPYTYALQYDPSFKTTYNIYNATINYKLGSAGTFTNSTSYASYRDREVEDYSLYYGGPYNACCAPTAVPANAAQPLLFGPELNKFSEELRFTSQRLGAFEGLAGLYFTNEQIGFDDHFYNSIPPSLQPIPGPSGNILSFSTPADYKEEAGFADLTFYAADTLDFTLGGRYSHNRQTVTSCQSGFLTIPGCTFNNSSDSDFTYLASVHWQPVRGLNAYARVATSYRPGGPQSTPLPGYPTSFKPDSLINYEVGLKGEWLDDRLRTNLAVYDMIWKDVQMTSNIGGYAQISNGAKATVKGVELETLLLPIAHLTIGVNVAYTDAKLNDVSAAVSSVTGAVAGDALPFTPTWAASAIVDYIQPLSSALTGTVGATYRYQGSRWSDYPGDPLNTGIVIPHYDAVDIRAGLKWSRYELQARASNLFNSHGLDTVVDQRITGNPPAFAAIIPPRMVTLSFSVTF